MQKLKYGVPELIPYELLADISECLYGVVGGLVEYELNDFVSSHKISVDHPDVTEGSEG